MMLDKQQTGGAAIVGRQAQAQDAAPRQIAQAVAALDVFTATVVRIVDAYQGEKARE